MVERVGLSWGYFFILLKNIAFEIVMIDFVFFKLKKVYLWGEERKYTYFGVGA